MNRGKLKLYFKIILNYILGYVNILVEGYFVEKFINICNKQKIFLWNLKRSKTTIIYANVSIKDFKKLKPIAQKTKCKIKIKSKKGLPFIFNKYKKRKIFVIGLAMVLITIFTLSKFIWNIEVIGNEKINADEIIQIANENNLKIGKFKNKVDTKKIINKLRLERDDIAWIGIEIKGTNAIIKIVESIPKPNIIDDEEFCNIVATKDAIIKKISAQNGTPVVKEGEIVKKGTVLIAGWLEGKYTGTRYVHATGSVQGKVWYTQKERIYFKQQKKEQTGNVENKYSLNINNFKINFNKGVSKFKNYDTIETNKKVKLFSNFYLPIELIKITNTEVNITDITYTLEEAKNIGIEKAKQELNNKIENLNNILSIQINDSQTSEYIEVEVTYEMLENIGTKEKIVF
ncbi:MAG TPA: sporulation protein YqfD [Clostridiales bacterium]|jgi:sporulation protein yqfD|nr:sporulation protein YqfD [Clostridiales bacterium]